MPQHISEKELRDYRDKLYSQMIGVFPIDQQPTVRIGWRGVEGVVKAPPIPVSRGEEIQLLNAQLETEHFKKIEALKKRSA